MTDTGNEDPTQSFVALAAGTTVSQFKIVRMIGTGGMGEVYLALDTKLNRQAALKFLSSHLCHDADCRNRFKREAQAAARLDHPNIAAIYEVGEYRGRPYYAMQAVHGQSLKDIIAEGELSLERALSIATQVCEGLQAAHAAGVIHRDIKPSNILLDRNDRVRIIDFGLATVRGAEHLTKTGSTMGTVGYMSPEQVLGKQVDHRSDLFSLGVVLYELVANQRPFRGPDDASVLHAISHVDPEPLLRYKSGVPDDVQRIVSKLLEKKPENRYQTAQDLAVDLRRASTASGRQILAKRRALSSKTLIPILLILVLVVLTLVLKPWQYLLSLESSKKVVPRRLAVLYLENQGAPDDEYLSWGITEDLIVDLTRAGKFAVTPMRSVVQYRDSLLDLPEISKRLQVDLVLDGSLYRSGNVIRVSAQLVDMETGTNLWANRWEEKMDSLPHIKNALATGITNALALNASQMREAQIGLPDATNPLAYDMYLRGKYTFQHKADKSDIEVALGLYEKAVELEPLLLAARIGIADVYFYQAKFEQARQILDSVAYYARKLGLRSDEADASVGLALYYGIMSQWESALESAQHALTISTELGDLAGEVKALSRTIGIYRMQGSFDKAKSFFNRVFELNRRLDDRAAQAQSLLSLGNLYFDQNNADSAAAFFDSAYAIATSIDDKSLEAITLDAKGALAFNKNDMDEAAGLLAEALAINQQLGQQVGVAQNLSLLGSIYYANNDLDSALQMYGRAMDIYERLGMQRELGWNLCRTAQLHADRGDSTSSIQTFEEAVEISSDVADFQTKLGALAGLINIYGARRLHGKCLEYVESAEEVCMQLDRPEILRSLLNAKGTLLNNIGEYDRAVKTLLPLLPHDNAPTDSALYADNNLELGRSYLCLGEYEAAARHLHLALPVLELSAGSHDLARSHLYLGELHYSLGDNDLSNRHFNILDTLAAGIADTEMRFIASAYLAALDARRGKREEGVQRLELLLSQSKERNMPEERVRVLRLLGQTLMDAGADESSYTKAKAYLEEALDLAEEANVPCELNRIRSALSEHP